jgi:uncharacterized protein (DUF1015 family)
MEIKPFKALCFDSSVVGDVGLCVSPPYDVIDDEMQQRLYDKSPYNVVRIIKPKDGPAENQGRDKYARAAEIFREFIAGGALKQNTKEEMYAYVQDFTIGNETFQRQGFVALGKLEEFGNRVHPHEKTLEGPKADRLNLLRATAAQFGQVFMLYDDPEKVADNIITEAVKGEALVDFVDEDDVRHRLFAIDGSDDINAIVEMMTDKITVIADGHHRYETALNYYAETNNPSAAYRMMTFVNMQNPGLIILPTHRLISNVAGFNMQELVNRLADAFEVTTYQFDNEAEKSLAREKMFGLMEDNFERGKSCLGIYAADGGFYVATLKDSEAVNQISGGLSDAAKSLDVNILHKLILEDILGIGDKQLAAESNVEYVKDIGDAIDKSISKVDSGQSQAVFFMNPTRIEQVEAVAQAGEKMPQKSTFFYPKVYTGLVVNKF